MTSPTPLARRVGIAAAAAFASALMLAACGSGGSTAGSGTVSGATGAEATQAQSTIKALQGEITAWPGVHTIASPADLTGKKYMIVPLTTTAPVLKGIAEFGKEALQKDGAQATICDGKANPNDVTTCLTTAAAQKYDGVVGVFTSYMMVPNVYQQVANAGLQVLIVGDAPIPGQTYPKNVQFQDYGPFFDNTSANQATAAVADLGTKTNAIVLKQTDTANTKNQADTVVSTLKKLCSSCKSTVIEFGRSSGDKLPSQIAGALTSDPTINTVIVNTDDWLLQARQGVQQAGKTPGIGAGKVELNTNAADANGLQLVAQGVVAHDLGASAVFMGYSLADAVVTQASGEKVMPLAPHNRDFVPSNVKGLKISDDEYYTTDWYGSDSFKDKFLAAWGK